MAEPWNLSPDEWTKVLESDKRSSVERVAENVKTSHKLPWADALIRYSSDAQSILDMGSGRGELAATMARLGKTATLMDWSADNIEFSRALFQALGLDGRFERADMTKRLPFADEAFDVVYSCGVFEYFDDDQIKAILKEAFRIAKKRVIIMVPNAWSLPYRVGKWYMEWKKKWVWGGEHPYATLKPHFRAATNGKLVEFSVGAKHSLDFLTMPGGQKMARVLDGVFKMKDHPNPAFLNQGYLLITIGEKA